MATPIQYRGATPSNIRRIWLLLTIAVLLSPAAAIAQSPWERAALNLFYSFVAGVLIFATLYVFALWSTKRDPEMLRILLSSSQFKPRYDGAKHHPFEVELRPW